MECKKHGQNESGWIKECPKCLEEQWDTETKTKAFKSSNTNKK